VGGGCRGRALAVALVAAGHVVRISSRRGAARKAIEEAGAECWAGTPDVVGSLRYALENVTVMMWALGTASGDRDELATLHGSRLEMMLWTAIDSSARGVVYEAAGTVDAAALDAGADAVARIGRRAGIPFAVVRTDPRQLDRWVDDARSAIESLLGPGLASQGRSTKLRPKRNS